MNWRLISIVYIWRIVTATQVKRYTKKPYLSPPCPSFISHGGSYGENYSFYHYYIIIYNIVNNIIYII